MVVSLHGDQVAAVRPILLLLQAGVLALLLIGAVNLVNLLLIRASGRLKELAVRQALGASRRRMMMEILVETFMLAFAFFRLTAICQGVYKRALDGNASNPEKARLYRYMVSLLAGLAVELVDAES